jgi:hypothetical protein
MILGKERLAAVSSSLKNDYAIASVNNVVKYAG